ncbi:MAG: hypothetical protein N3H31_00610 [Candidatus Nezhaarchaeota archaeon]|nr:hypothetical protein [Candidatus Nezhaarchaeota archaeon]
MGKASPGSLAFTLSSLALLLLGLYLSLMLALPLSLSPPPSIPEAAPHYWFLTTRALDTAFLAMAVLAATLGVAALFRYEGERPGPEEEVLVEGEVEEAGEEEV